MTRKLSDAELRCMLDHGSHDFEMYETWADAVVNRVRERVALWRRNVLWIENIHVHERCRNCGKVRRAK